MVYQNGRVYEGEWVDDRRHGRGYERFSNGNIYQGYYIEGKAHGKGVYHWQHGEVYDGEWVNGIKEGYGIWKGDQGESYIGQWKNSKAEGYGVHTWRNGDKYEGEWRACLRNGNGSDFFSNGDQYIGQYKYGNPNGFGQYKWMNGNTYAGEFVNGLKQGKGKWKKKLEEGEVSNNCFEGEYKADMKNGFGEFSWASGNKYRGNYVDDKREGYGEMQWIDGSIYRGYWDDGIQEGLGVMIFPDGFKKAGFFIQNIFKESLETIEQLNEFIKDEIPNGSIPEFFKQELKEYLGFYDHNSDEDKQFIDKEFRVLEFEDLPDPTQFVNMQEILSYSTGEGRTKGDYAALIEAEDLQKKISEDEMNAIQLREKGDGQRSEFSVQLPSIKSRPTGSQFES